MVKPLHPIRYPVKMGRTNRTLSIPARFPLALDDDRGEGFFRVGFGEIGLS